MKDFIFDQKVGGYLLKKNVLSQNDFDMIIPETSGMLHRIEIYLKNR